MKYFFLFLLLICFRSASYCQQLSIEYFEKSSDNSAPDYNNTLTKKGFQPDSDIVQVNYHKYSFVNKNASERIEWISAIDKEKAKTYTIRYYLPQKNNYKNFIRAIKKSTYKKQSSKLYRFNANSYSYQSFLLNGDLLFNNQNYYLITFTKFEGKELSMPEK